MNCSLPTVAVEIDCARVVINESDFNAEIHSLWVDEKTEDKKQEEATEDELEIVEVAVEAGAEPVRAKPGRKPKSQ